MEISGGREGKYVIVFCRDGWNDKGKSEMEGVVRRRNFIIMVYLSKDKWEPLMDQKAKADREPDGEMRS